METNPMFDRPSSASSDGGSGEDVRELSDAFITPEIPGSPIKSAGISPKSPLKSGSAGKRRSRTTSTSTTKQGSTMVRSGSRTIYTAGRPPWYDSHGQLEEPFVIGICGGSASGKTTVAKRIIEALDVQWVSLLSLDSFYKVLNEEQHDQAMLNNYNFDHPDAFDFELVYDTLKRLKEGKSVHVPVYNFSTHAREKDQKTIYGANVVIFEGILAFASPKVLELMDTKVFVDTDSDIRLARRLKRDISERGRELAGVLHQYNKFVKPAFDQYIEPSRQCADIVVPRELETTKLIYGRDSSVRGDGGGRGCEVRADSTYTIPEHKACTNCWHSKGGENTVALDLIVNHVHQQLYQRGHRLRSKLMQAAHEGQPLPESLHVLECTQQVKGLHTFIRDRKTARDEFIFYSNRLMRLLIEFALSLLPFKDLAVDTPQSMQYAGKRLNCASMCGVSVLRAGETMEPALAEVCKDIRLGKILIQTNLDTGEPELHYLRLPRDIAEQQVLLMDATVATGAAAMMAIRVLLDHDVPEENIMLLSLLMAESGVHSVAYAFPKVKLVTTAVDPKVNDHFHILPGIGNFGDRYFGTGLATG